LGRTAPRRLQLRIRLPIPAVNNAKGQTMTKQELAEIIAHAPITACTRCGRTIDQTDAGCRNDVMGKHRWWTGTRREWFSAWRDR
jgi:hypothetical protein